MTLEESMFRLSQEKTEIKEELVQTRKKLEKLDVLKGMLATLLKGKTTKGTSQSMPPSPISCNIVGEQSVPRTREQRANN